MTCSPHIRGCHPPRSLLLTGFPAATIAAGACTAVTRLQREAPPPALLAGDSVERLQVLVEAFRIAWDDNRLLCPDPRLPVALDRRTGALVGVGDPRRQGFAAGPGVSP